MSNVLIDRQKIDILANAISDKSGVPVTMTLAEMVDAVDGIETGGGEPNLQAKTYTVESAGTATITADSGYDGLSGVEVSVPSGNPDIIWSNRGFYTESNQRKWRVRPFCDFPDGEGYGWMGHSVVGDYLVCSAVPSNTTITPTESAQTIGGWSYMMEGAVTVNAIPSTYVGSGITRRDSTDLSASGATVTVPSGYYSAQASKSVASGTAGTPTATKGTVSNHSVSVTPSVTNTTGYITGSTKTGTAVTVSASELVSGSQTLSDNGDYDVTNLASVTVSVSGGGEYTRTVIAPQQTVTPTSAMQQMTLTSTGLIEDAKSYIVTIDNVEWLTTCETLWSSNYCIGDARYYLEASPSSTIYPFGAICENGVVDACFATTGSHTIKIERLDFVTGGTTLTTKSITANGTYTATSDSADGYSSVTVNVPSVQPTLQTKSVSYTPTETAQSATVTADSGYDGLDAVNVSVGAISNTYVGTGITRRSSTDLTASGATVTVPSGYYSAQASKSVASGTAGTPTATKGTVSNHSVSVTPSVTNTAGYISGGTINGTAVTVSASELVSGSETKTENGTYDVTNLAQLIVNVSGGSGGLEYETGTLTLSSDASTPIVMFSETHTDVPCYINIVDTTGTTATSNSNLYWTFMNWYTPFDAIIKTTNSANMYGRYQYGWKSSSGASAGNIDCTNTGSSSGGLNYLVSTDRFGPYCGSANRYWRSGRTYKWIAVWAPPTT